MNNINTFSRRRFLKTGSLWAAATAAMPIVGVAAAMAKQARIPEPDEDLAAIKNIIQGKKPAIWVFTGDSITQGAKHTLGFRSYQEVFAERVRWEMGRVNDFVINTACSGNTSKDIVENFDWRIAQFKPAIVSLMIGTNDAAVSKNVSQDLFEKNLVDLVTRIRALGAIPILHTPNIIVLATSNGREALGAYVSIIRAVAAKLHVVLVDHYQYWTDNIDKPGVEVYVKWLNDPLHPNGTGHLQLARLLFKKLSIFDSNSFTCSADIYEVQH